MERCEEELCEDIPATYCPKCGRVYIVKGGAMEEIILPGQEYIIDE